MKIIKAILSGIGAWVIFVCIIFAIAGKEAAKTTSKTEEILALGLLVVFVLSSIIINELCEGE